VKNGENITASFTTTATQTGNVGTFTITAAAVFTPTTLAANYTLTTTNATLTVTAVPLRRLRSSSHCSNSSSPQQAKIALLGIPGVKGGASRPSQIC
jgi:ribosome-binding ATPase YchF (GTP1/OBG family)